ncbi:MAG: caspase family protein [Saprospiraceae bacterium]
MKYYLLLFFAIITLTAIAQHPKLILQKGHTAPITDIAISEDGRLAASASFDGTIRLWDVLSKKELGIYEMENTGSMGQFEVELKDDFLVGFGAGKIKTWNIKMSELIAKGTYNVSAVAIDKNDNLLIGDENGQVTPSFSLTLEGIFGEEMIHNDWVEEVKISNDGKYFLTASSDGLLLWNKKNGKIVDTLTTQAVNTANFSYDNQYIVAGGFDGIVRVFRVDDGAFINALELHENRLIYTDISRDNGTIISTDVYGKIAVWNTQTNDTIRTIETHKGLRSVALHPDGRTLFVGFRNRLRLYRTTTGKQITEFKGLVDDWKSKYINYVDFDKNNQQFITSENGIVRFWGAAAGDKIRLNNNVMKAIFHPIERYIATNESDGSVVLFDMITYDTIRTFEGKGLQVHWADNGRLLVGEWGQQFMIWQTSTGRLLKAFDQPEKDDYRFTLHDNGQIAAIYSTKNGTITLYKIFEGERFLRIKTDNFNYFNLAFCSDNYLAVGADGGDLDIWDIQKEEKIKTIKAHETAVAKLWADREYIVTADVNGEMKVWNMNFELVRTYKEHTEVITAIDRKDDYIITSAADNSVRLWDINKDKSLGKIYAFGDDWAVITADGLFDGSPNAFSKMHYVIGLESLELSQLKERYFEPGLLGKLLKISDEPLRDVSMFDAVPLYPIATLEWENQKELRLKVTLEKRNGGIGKVSLFINKKELVQDINPRHRKEFVIKLDEYQRFMDFDGEDFFSVKTYNKAGWLSSKPERIRYVPEVNSRGEAGGITIQLGKKHEPKLYAIVIGTSDYRGEKLDLSYADKDAADVATGLEGVGEALFGAESVEINLLTSTTDLLSTKANIQSAFAKIAAEAMPEDVVVIYLSGHGVTYGSTDAQFYYLTKEVASEDIADATIRDNFTIATSELTEMLKAIPAQKQVLIIDACSSGSLVDNVLSQTRNLPSSQRRALDRMKDRTGIFILAGSAANKVSYEASQFGQGLLTYSLLLGMNGSALRDNQYVDVMQLFQFAADKVPEFAAFIGGMQRPVIATPAGTNSFDIGQLTEDVVIPMTEVKPLFVRSNFQEENSFADILDLGTALDNRLNDISAQGKSASILFVNVKKYPNAYAVKGRYTIDATGIVTLKVNVFKGEQVVKNFTVNGSMSYIEGIINDVLKEVE